MLRQVLEGKIGLSVHGTALLTESCRDEAAPIGHPPETQSQDDWTKQSLCWAKAALRWLLEVAPVQCPDDMQLGRPAQRHPST